VENLKLGSIVSFSDYSWRVLDIQEHAALLITKDSIGMLQYHNAYKDITWADCSLRAYLNGAFYDKFSAADKTRINPVINENFDNQWYGAKGGEVTEDRIFILSIEESVCKYFGDSSAILQNPGREKYKYWFNKKDENNYKRLEMCWGWLRSPGRTNRTAAYIHGLTPSQLDSSGGCVGINGNNITSLYGVRPALWVKL